MIFINLGFSQLDPDSTQFISPVKHTMKLAGSFGELRTNHFHSGIDIKSKEGKEGDLILASEQGHISRIKIQSGGYGKALYIDHPNGYTTVYAHLQKFTPVVEAFVEKVQLELEKFEVDIYLDESSFAYEQGEQIGILGNTGRSYAPHLHFEIRETKTERPVLPSKFNLTVKDELPPVMQELYVYELDENGNILDKKRIPIRGEKGVYESVQDLIEVGSDFVGIGTKAYDRSDGVWNKNGIYSMRISDEDSTFFQVVFDQFDFSESKAINAVIDYKHFEANKTRIIKLFGVECLPLSNYNIDQQTGWLAVSNDKPKSFNIEIGDNYENISSISLKLQKTEKSIAQKESGFFLQCGIADTLDLPSGASISFDPQSLYESQHIAIREEGEGSFYKLSILNSKSPVHYPFELSIPMETKGYTFVKYGKERLENFGGRYDGNYYKISLDEFGTYGFYQDKKAPILSRVATTYQDNSKQYRISLEDNLDYDSSLGDPFIQITACGHWVNYFYDVKNDLISVDKKYIPLDCQQFRIIARDHDLNEAELIIKFR